MRSYNVSVVIVVTLFLSACGAANSAYYYASLTALNTSTSLAQANRQALTVDRGPSYYAPVTEPAEPAEDKVPEPESPDSAEADSSQVPTKPRKTPSTPVVTPAPVNLPRAISFQLEDQTGKKTAVTFPRNQPIILAIADQEGSKQMEAWIKPLYQRYTERVDIEGIADVAGIPALVRGIAKGVISALVKQPVMLDWEGVAVRHFGAQKKRTTIIVIDAEGRVHGKLSGPVTADGLAAVQAKMDAILAAAAEE